MRVGGGEVYEGGGGYEVLESSGSLLVLTFAVSSTKDDEWVSNGGGGVYVCVDSAHNTIIIQKRGFLAVCTGTWMRGRTNNIL